jgi:hypothetical protein
MDVIKFKCCEHKDAFYKAVVSFLKDINVYDLFIYEAQRRDRTYNLETYVLKKGGYDLINESLIWSQTDNGRMFWSSINKAYNDWWHMTAPLYKNCLPKRYQYLFGVS